ncbi:13054_t:CDS:2 [Acaulospora morrowiae]|uniref:13054_t:CDS:1 n=1 Tax=Acaulospora morrowiae TaxID=94023 RepID=A0A9N9NBK3_9GLOM|nr:13054_t:CDS:2 [Acaulospora morrowiae]
MSTEDEALTNWRNKPTCCTGPIRHSNGRQCPYLKRAGERLRKSGTSKTLQEDIVLPDIYATSLCPRWTYSI